MQGETTLHTQREGREGGRREPLQRPVAFNPMCRSLGRLNLVTSKKEKDVMGRGGGRAGRESK
jgi:hypothetical protein